ncbi:ABC transporter permease [Nocardioides sp. BP30]|uniref:ABC transporter permease n=1 Tax=Nocardioides sp. BP30 TaxID=3036374 RepID=UPI0024699268|nr:ABC transporter permease [Nocardioides sp. BP30]WGL50426.1 ABC transporter permease [Nocardioides sp. BP30]
MFAYIVRRAVIGVALLIVMSLVTFILFFSGAFDPARNACGKVCSPAQIAQTKKALGYDKPLVVQWGKFLKGVVAGRDYPDDPALRKANPSLVTHCAAPCLGYSMVNTTTVNSELKSAAPVSISIAIVAFVLWIIGGLLFGIIAAMTKGSFLDRGIVGLSLVFYAFPTFVIGLLLLRFVAIRWQIFELPVYVPFTQNPGLWLTNLILPALTLALFYMAAYARMSRAFIIEASGEDYVRTAKAKGVKRVPLLLKHTLRAALTPLVTMAGLDLAILLGGAIITENVFTFHGLGLLAVTSNSRQDLPTIVGIVLLLSAFVIVANVIVDILYAFIDPRVRLV